MGNSLYIAGIMDEFSLIAKYFRPLAKDFPGALNLQDDAAHLRIPAGHKLVVTNDAITAGVHFKGDEDAAHIARKALRVNLSDLAGKGATPLCYFLALMLPEAPDEQWLARFAQGLAQDQQEFGITLAGGDTTAIKGPLTLAVTALGLVPDHAMLKRGGAHAGDEIYVSGTLGAAALSGYTLLPEPRLALGQSLLGVASACMDISDGLVQDLGHLCTASGVSSSPIAAAKCSVTTMLRMASSSARKTRCAG